MLSYTKNTFIYKIRWIRNWKSADRFYGSQICNIFFMNFRFGDAKFECEIQDEKSVAFQFNTICDSSLNNENAMLCALIP